MAIIDEQLLSEQTSHRGAFVEQSGRNRWQPLANETALETAQIAENRCRGLRRVAAEMPW
jgi:hypothetical protein